MRQQKDWKLGKTYQHGEVLRATYGIHRLEALGYSEKQADRMAFEEFKEHSKKLTKMEDNRPKLYGLIMKI
jgi:hypothetical protein